MNLESQSNKTLHRTAIPLRFIVAGEPGRLAVEMAIEKSETTAMQWLKKQTQNN